MCNKSDYFVVVLVVLGILFLEGVRMYSFNNLREHIDEKNDLLRGEIHLLNMQMQNYVRDAEYQ